MRPNDFGTAERPRAASRRRILLSVHSASLGGGELMALAEAKYLKRTYDLVISLPEGPLRDRFACHGEIIGGTTSMPLWGDSARRWLGRCARTVRQALWLTRVIRECGIDVVLTSSSVSVVPVLAARLAGVPVIVHARDVPGSRLAPLIFRMHGALAQTVIVISSRLSPYFSVAGGARIKLIADGIEVPIVPGLDSLAEKSSVMHDPVRLCVIGGVSPRKGQDIAVEALAELHRHGVDAALDIVGREIDPSFASSVRRLAAAVGVGQRVRFLGEVDDVPGHLKDVDIVIAPSRGEWTPLVLMEAMAQQKPVVAANVGAVGDVVIDGDTGLLTAPEDPPSLARAVGDLVRDPLAAAQIAVRGRLLVKARFDVNATLIALEQEIRRLLADGVTRA